MPPYISLSTRSLTSFLISISYIYIASRIVSSNGVGFWQDFFPSTTTLYGTSLRPLFFHWATFTLLEHTTKLYCVLKLWTTCLVIFRFLDIMTILVLFLNSRLYLASCVFFKTLITLFILLMLLFVRFSIVLCGAVGNEFSAHVLLIVSFSQLQISDDSISLNKFYEFFLWALMSPTTFLSYLCSLRNGLDESKFTRRSQDLISKISEYFLLLLWRVLYTAGHFRCI